MNHKVHLKSNEALKVTTLMFWAKAASPKRKTIFFVVKLYYKKLNKKDMEEERI
jgi:hypothetical protein